jgi:hypothetical protein
MRIIGAIFGAPGMLLESPLKEPTWDCQEFRA